MQPQLTKILISQIPDVVGCFEYGDRYYRSLEHDGRLEKKNKTIEKENPN